MSGERRIGAAIFVAVFGLYLLSSGREPAWGDARSMWEVAARIVDGGHLDITTRWPTDIPAGRNGKYYGITPIGPSLVHVPGAAATAIVHHFAPTYEALAKPLFTHLAPAALGALTCVLFFLLLIELGAQRKTASVCTAMLAMATTLWVYARMPYSEILQITCFLGWFRQVLRTCETPTRREALWLGTWAGMLLNAKYVFALPIATGLALVGFVLRKRREQLVTVVKWAAVPGVPLLVLALFYNWFRWGSITASGYEPYLAQYFGGTIFDGAWGMLLSPNKSALLYSPPLVLAVFGWPHVIRKHPRAGWALLTMVVPTFLVYCTYRSWAGEWAWGPRFFVWCVPVLCVGIYGFIDGVAAAWSRRVRVAVIGAVFALGVCVQLLGSSLYWDHFIRVAIDAKNQWLGNPNRSGAFVPEKGRGHCDGCFEDTYETLWLPAFQPMRGQWWLLKSVIRDDDQASAQADAPWRTYTTATFNLRNSFWPRLDWWGLLWIKDATRTWLAGVVLLLAFTATTAWGVLRWLRLHRSLP